MKRNNENIGRIERRFFAGDIQKRAQGESNSWDFGGLASSTGVEYTMYEDAEELWVEVIDRAAFDDVLEDDVRCLFNHDSNFVLGRCSANTCGIWKSESGLEYGWKKSSRSYAQDLEQSIELGEVNQSSFGFRTSWENNKWEEYPMEDGRRKYVRTILKIDELYDVSPVTFPANPNTSAGKRDFAEALKEYRATKEAAESSAKKNNFYQDTYRRQEILLKRQQMCL